MQTFLPTPSFSESAYCLDNKRLNKQITEAYQIYKALIGAYDREDGKPGAWTRHPATLMWRGYLPALMLYHNEMLAEWLRRGFNYSRDPFNVPKAVRNRRVVSSIPDMPPWLGMKAFHESHQSNLVRKHPEHYRRYFPYVRPDIPYFWPTKEGVM